MSGFFHTWENIEGNSAIDGEKKAFQHILFPLRMSQDLVH